MQVKQSEVDDLKQEPESSLLSQKRLHSDDEEKQENTNEPKRKKLTQSRFSQEIPKKKIIGQFDYLSGELTFSEDSHKFNLREIKGEDDN